MPVSQTGGSKRLRSWAKAKGPGIGPLRRELSVEGVSFPEVDRAFAVLNLDITSQVDWRVLAALLAFDKFYPGKKRGPKELIWTTNRSLELLSLIDQFQSKHKCSRRRACKLIAKDKDSPVYFRIALGALYKAAQRASKLPKPALVSIETK